MRTVLVVLESGTEVFKSSAIVRAYQYSNLFQNNQHVRATFTSRKPPQYVRLLSHLHRRWWSRPLASIMARLDGVITHLQERAVIQQSRNFDLIYLLRVNSTQFQKAIWNAGKAKIVMDLNDPLWIPCNRRNGVDFEQMLQYCHAVACENDYLAEYARKYNSNVHLVPDSPQVEEFDKIRNRFKPQRDRITLGWIGGGFAADNLHSIFEPLEELFSRHHNLHLRVLGANPSDIPRFEKVIFSCKPSYTNEQMIQEALQMDIGLFPLYRTQDSIGRGTLKPRIYMSAGITAVCQRWGMIPDLIQHKINGVLAESPDDWFEELDWLISNPVERHIISENGLATIRTRFTRQACFDSLISVFNTL